MRSQIAILLLMLVPCVALAQTESGISYLFPDHFSKVIEAEVLIVEKPNSYYANNFVNEPFYVKVLKIGSNSLGKAITVELNTSDPAQYTIGTTHSIRVYERLKEVGQPRDPTELITPQVDLHYVNYLQECPSSRNEKSDENSFD